MEPYKNNGANSQNYIKYENVSFRYETRGRYTDFVIRQFDVQISKGEFHVLLGPSGCGKSTVLNLLAGFVFPSEGRVLAAGRSVTAPGVDRVMIFQGDESLYPWLTAVENVEFGLRVAGVDKNVRRRQAMQHLELVGLHDQDGKFPSQLSGGMKQRVQLARALASHSDILLMDEPFGALDAQTRGTLQMELSAIWQRTGGTILFVTHDIVEAILLADRISVMTSGPGATIEKTIEIQMQRPRSIADRDFGNTYADLTQLLGSDATLPFTNTPPMTG